jgi:hypothetical protein
MYSASTGLVTCNSYLARGENCMIHCQVLQDFSVTSQVSLHKFNCVTGDAENDVAIHAHIHCTI